MRHDAIDRHLQRLREIQPTDPRTIGYMLTQALRGAGKLARAYTEVDFAAPPRILFALGDQVEGDVFLYALDDVRLGHGLGGALDLLDRRTLANPEDATPEQWAAWVRVAAAVGTSGSLEELYEELVEPALETFPTGLPSKADLQEVFRSFDAAFGATSAGGPDPTRLDVPYRRVITFCRAA